MWITVDGGTTNTRLCLMDGDSIVAKVKKRVGARNNTVGGRNTALYDAVRDGIAELTNADVTAVILSGMIGSEAGLANIPHIAAPAGIEELTAGIRRVDFPEISPLPFLFIPGVKTFVNPTEQELDDMDIMRGEETEIVGILSLSGMKSPMTVVLPGSHMKIANIDRNGKITSFRTSITGELTRAAAENTILAQTFGDTYPRIADTEWLQRGYAYAERHSISEALFKIRVSANFRKEATKEQLYAFLMGAILYGDIQSILSDRPSGVVVAGSDPYRSAIAVLLNGKVSVTVLSDTTSESAAAVGASKIASRYKVF